MPVPQVAIDAVEFYLQQKKISKAAAVGIVAVCYAGESQLNPGSQGAQSTETPGALNPSGAYGICSWNGPRQAALQAYATAKNLPVGAVDTQLAFILTEAANSYPKFWATIQDAAATYSDIVTSMVDNYEVPADASAEVARSMTFAAELNGVQFDPAPAASTPARVATPTPTSASAPAPTSGFSAAEKSALIALAQSIITIVNAA